MSPLFGSLAIIAGVMLILMVAGGALATVPRSGTRHGTSGSLSSAAPEIQSLLEPEKKRAVETMQFAQESEDEDDRLQSPPR